MPAIDIQLQSLSPDAEIELFEFNATPEDLVSPEVYYFHNGTNELGGSVVFNGVTYNKYAIEVSGYDKDSTGPIPRVRVRVSNTLRLFTSLALNFNDLLRAKLIRRRTFTRFLDAVNFVGGVNLTADPNQVLPEDTHYLYRKVSEGKDLVDLEFAGLTDLENIMLPRRTMQLSCGSTYREPNTCAHVGVPLFTKEGLVLPVTADVPPFPDHNVASAYVSGKCVVITRFDDGSPRKLAISKISVPTLTPITSTTHWAYAGCPKQLSFCKALHGSGAELPFGGFPGLKRLPTT